MYTEQWYSTGAADAAAAGPTKMRGPHPPKK